jgi:uncharacterized membrane protein
MAKLTGSKSLNRLLLAVLALAVLGTAAALIYAITAPPAEKFTEFYILGAEGEAKNYPKQLKVGEEASLTLGIINREQTPVSYRVEISIDGVKQGEVGPISLASNEKREQAITFTADKAENTQKVEFLLYKEDQSEVIESLYLVVNVTD